MFDIDFSRAGGRALLRIIGDLDGEDDRLHLLEALTFVQEHDHFVLDLSLVQTIGPPIAREIHEVIKRRMMTSETVVVAAGETVSLMLVLHNVDRLSPIVPNVEEAVGLLDRWSAGRGHPKAVTVGGGG